MPAIIAGPAADLETTPSLSDGALRNVTRTNLLPAISEGRLRRSLKTHLAATAGASGKHRQKQGCLGRSRGGRGQPVRGSISMKTQLLGGSRWDQCRPAANCGGGRGSLGLLACSWVVIGFGADAGEGGPWRGSTPPTIGQARGVALNDRAVMPPRRKSPRAVDNDLMGRTPRHRWRGRAARLWAADIPNCRIDSDAAADGPASHRRQPRGRTELAAPLG